MGTQVSFLLFFNGRSDQGETACRIGTCPRPFTRFIPCPQPVSEAEAQSNHRGNLPSLACFLFQPLARLGANVTGVDAGFENVEAAKQHARLDPSLRDKIHYRSVTEHCSLKTSIVIRIANTCSKFQSYARRVFPLQ